MWARRSNELPAATNKKGGDFSPPRWFPLNNQFPRVLRSKSRLHILRLRCGFGLGSGLLVAQDGFAAQANLVALDRQYLHENLIAFLQLVANRPDARLRDFADVQ